MGKVYEIITERILQKLAEGVVPWRKTWRGPEPHQNLVSRRPYRGINVFLLGMQGFRSPFWVTFKQIDRLGGRIRKGESGSIVVLWKWIEKVDPETGKPTDSVPLLRYYRVWNVEQTDGIEVPQPEAFDFEPIAAAEEILREMPERPPVVHQDLGKAWYDPWGDRVNLPRPETFESPEEFYCCAYHELIHSSGHRSRLDRPGVVEVVKFGGHAYSKEELVAEMGAAFLCGVAGIEQATLANSAAYIHGWRRVIGDDPKLVVHAAAQAQKAADFILGRRFGDEAADSGV
jgi:antirestriction protein ArdC